MSEWAYAGSSDRVSGKVKLKPEDFLVVERMEVEPCGSGEHVWLKIQKTKLNSEQVAKALARHANIAFRDVGYSGLKDNFAVTEQWFSVWLPGSKSADWKLFDLNGAEILRTARHGRKIKRGTHRANHFNIRIRTLRGDLDNLQRELESVRDGGVPNYFGPQRFGREAGNMTQALKMFAGRDRVKNRNHRSMLLSAARAWLFNTVLSARVAEGSWDSLYNGEPANLDGSASIFSSHGSADEAQRLAQLDIHPTAPMWGDFDTTTVQPYSELHQFEVALLRPYQQLTEGLVSSGLTYQRRPTRCKVQHLDWQIDNDCLQLQFELNRGQFATSVLRELIT